MDKGQYMPRLIHETVERYLETADAVIELPDGGWCGIEIKLGANKIEEAAMNLLRIRGEIKKVGGRLPYALCVLCGLSNAAYQRPDGVFVVPLTALKN